MLEMKCPEEESGLEVEVDEAHLLSQNTHVLMQIHCLQATVSIGNA